MIVEIDGRKAELYNLPAKPLEDGEVPKSWKFVKTVWHSMGNSYNPSTAAHYKTSTGKDVLSIYRDGCFYPYALYFQFKN